MIKKREKKTKKINHFGFDMLYFSLFLACFMTPSQKDDYDSEYQDIFMRTAVALMDNEITVHEALIYQYETEQGHHTAKSGLFLRDFPGRLILYPLVASTCAVIFFNGSWIEFGIAAICGLATGLVEMLLGKFGFGILTDTFVGTITGVIAGLFYRYGDQDNNICISSVFLGTLYWFFYGKYRYIIAGEKRRKNRRPRT